MDVIDKLEYKLSILEEIENKEARRKLLRLHNHIKLAMGISLVSDDSASLFSNMLNNDHILEQLDDLASKYLGVSGRRQYAAVEIHTYTDKLPHEVCEVCGNSLEQEDLADVLVCSYCAYVKYINQTLTSTRSKIGNSDPKRHFIYWMTHIFGLEDESEVLGDGIDIISKIRTGLAYKNKSIEHLTIDDIRDALKEVGMSKLYTNASFIARKITGRFPPRLSEEQYLETQNLFLEAMRIREGLTYKINNNKIYYPYYIYKIFDIILKNDDKKCMNYIHLHKPDTMRTNDTEWKLICESIPRLNGKYVSTITSKDRYI